jgi:hypothetical protein
MSTYSEILDEEVEFKKPARFTTGRKFRDNVLAIAAGDATVPNDKRVDPRGMRRPTSAVQTFRLAEQLSSAMTTTSGSPVKFFVCRVIVPGVYTLAGISNTGVTDVDVLVNGSSVFTNSGSGAWTHQMTLAAGDSVVLTAERSSAFSEASVSDARFMSEYPVPILQGQFRS